MFVADGNSPMKSADSLKRVEARIAESVRPSSSLVESEGEEEHQ
jgi:hypothetical protein